MSDQAARNPFPAHGISAVEECFQPGLLHDWARLSPTAVLPGVQCAVAWAGDYLRELGEQPARDGGLGCLYGAHGAGKTHSARHMMAFVDEADPRAVQLYLRFTDGDFVAAYRRLMPQLSQELLIDLCLRQLGALAVEWIARHVGPQAGDRLSAEVRADPGRVFHLFDEHEVEEGEVLEAQAREIAAVAGDAPRFQRALSYLLRPRYSDAAYDWLCGRRISAESTRALGVGGRIDDPQMCRYALQLLATLVTRAGRPFVLVLDQCEKFLVDEASTAANAAVLQGLAEMIPRAGGMLLLLSNLEGWQRMPPDLRQRLGTHVCRLLPLTPRECELVLGAYLPARQGIAPFTDDGLRELLRRSGGNLRVLLQLSSASYAATTPGALIDGGRVAAAPSDHPRPPDLADLAMLVESRLLMAGVPVERVDDAGEAPVFLLPGARDTRARIALNPAIFAGPGPATGAAGSGGRPVFTALLVTGYVAPPELARLREQVHLVLVADGSEEFSRGLDDLVAHVTAALARAEPVRPEPAELDESVRALRAQLDELHPDRQESEEPAPAWPVRREEYTARIAEARAARTAADWEEFSQACERADRGLDRYLARLLPGRRPATGPVESKRDLIRAARELRSARDPDSPDPVIRYAFALHEDPDEGYQRLVSALLVESLALVRQAIGQRLAVSSRPPAQCVAEVLRGRRERVPEMLLLLARKQPHAEFDRPPRALRDLPPELRILVALANPGALELASGASTKQAAEAVLSALGVHGPSHPLARAYRTGIAEMAPGEVPPHELRAAARLLSPLEEDGLGTYDWLPQVSDIDGLYLFFEELLHYQDEVRAHWQRSGLAVEVVRELGGARKF
ncbi:hypothetical protein HII36_17350 [Nonomuraea sp. NN258]|uniref:hypothetical protein n=1 Tax=Nonomuraea antri TaxID=2730852 RepID=UPI00156A4B70|nr:hypothetical protein [Nonomuraea antri]NRQ33602.1 hypothetical protein [Nonomuraea antri]